MSNDDPFFSPNSDDRTVIRPIPGGRRTGIRRTPPSEQPAPTFSNTPLPQLGHLNPLESAASGLLALLTRLSNSRAHPDPSGLKNQVTEEIQVFQTQAHARSIDPESIFTARYILCTALDEAVLNTPWGQNSDWAQHSLLSSFHKEVSGGERFFQLLKSLGQNPAKNLHLLELMYLCLALGFEGRYRIVQDGKDKLIRIREWLYQLIQNARGSGERALSPHWQGVTDKRNPLMRFVPLWVFAAIAAGLLAALFTGFLLRLNHLSDPVFTQLHAIDVPRIEAPPQEPIVLSEPEVTLSMLLADEISRNLLSVDEHPQQSTVTIQGDGLFASGRATVKPAIVPLINRIGESLDQLNGQVLIVGHSDNVPIRSARFPSNWDLSKARAEAVAGLIKPKLGDPARVYVDARADAEPVASNQTAEGRAKNRRVEILLIK